MQRHAGAEHILNILVTGCQHIPKGGIFLKRLKLTVSALALCASLCLGLTGCGSSGGEQLIGRQAAKAIALEDAGFPEKWVIEMDVDYDSDGGQSVYDVFFINSTTKYSYVIDGDTGEIVSQGTAPLFAESD
jgi:uncharacterized membrane protein YkoI